MIGGQTVIVITASRPESPPMLQPTIRSFILADLKCYMCGATAGSIEREQGSTVRPWRSSARGTSD